jgi:DNA-directed RNA polymerase subunit RPC12/RpoP
MSGKFDSDSISGLKCPNCGRKIEATVGRLRLGDNSCSHCKTKFDSDKLNRALDLAESDTKPSRQKIGRSLTS